MENRDFNLRLLLNLTLPFEIVQSVNESGVQGQAFLVAADKGPSKVTWYLAFW